MSSTGGRLGNSRWQPTLPVPRRRSAAAQRIMRWIWPAEFLALAVVAGLDAAPLLFRTGRQPTTWSAVLAVLFVAMLAIVMVNVVVAGWLMGRMDKAEASGRSR